MTLELDETVHMISLVLWPDCRPMCIHINASAFMATCVIVIHYSTHPAQAVPVLVRAFESTRRPLMPKSHSLTLPFSSNRMLDGFTSARKWKLPLVPSNTISSGFSDWKPNGGAVLIMGTYTIPSTRLKEVEVLLTQVKQWVARVNYCGSGWWWYVERWPSSQLSWLPSEVITD